MTPVDYDYLRDVLKSRSGLVLGADKHYLVESRLLPVVRKVGLADLAELVRRLKQPEAEPLIAHVVEAMTTNETFFFRDRIPFDHFSKAIIPALTAARAKEKRIRVWCAAASTGQEPYTLAICLKELGAALAGWTVEIVATDISTDALEKAKRATYSQFEVQRGLPIMMLVKYFAQVGELWQLTPELRNMVQFKPVNLLNDLSRLGMFDVVFCRNVLIYFDQATKIDVLNRVARIMQPDGFLVLGAAESVVGLTDSFRPIADKRGLYAPRGASLKADGNVINFTATRAAMGGSR